MRRMEIIAPGTAAGAGGGGRTAPMPTELPVGTEIAGHRIEALIGRGGMGAVYLAEHLRLRRRVALKVLISDLAQDETFRARFIRASHIAASLDHPNAGTVYAAGEGGGLL